MKRCSGCGETKPVDQFNRNKQGRGGRRSRCKACQKAYSQVNAEAIAARKHARYAANAEAIAQQRRANPHRRWEHTYRQRVRRYGFNPVVETFTRADLIARYGDRCWHCGGPFEQLDHWPIAVVAGGPHTLDNVRPSCTPCNRSRNQAVA